MTEHSRRSMERLEQALAVYVDWVADGQRTDPARLRERHPELGDLLDAVLTDRAALPPDRGGGAKRRVGEFELLDEIGRGGMGVVYRARQPALGRDIALKVLPAHLTLQAAAIARFRSEASTAARLHHAGIVEIHAVGSDGDAHYFAMELVDGAPLSAVDPRGGARRPVREIVELCARVADALDHAHRHGVVHRDVKPSNILVRRDGSPVLTDFGLARALDEPGLTVAGSFAGTPYYVSPEQAAGTIVDGRSDVFSLGATLYELLTGRRPFDGPTAGAILDRITKTDPVDPLRLAPSLAPDLAAIVLKALEKDRDRRYRSAAEIAADLRAFLDFRPVTARRASAYTKLRRWARREPLQAAAAVVLLVAVAALGGAIGFSVSNANALGIGAAELRRQRIEQRLALSTIEYEAGDFERARDAAERALELDPRSVEAIALRALAQLALGDAAGAIAAVDRSDARPESLARARAWLLAALGRDDEARAIEQRLGDPVEAIDLFLSASVTAHRARRDRADPDTWRRVAAMFARAMHVSPAPRQHFFVRWADATIESRDAIAIRDCVETLRALWPDSPAALLYIGFALKDTEPAAAAAAYREVLTAGHDHPRIHSMLGHCLGRLGDAAGAREARTRAIAGYRARLVTGAASADDSVHLALALADVGDRAAARSAAERAAADHPSSPRAWITLGWICADEGDRDAAIRAYRHAVELAPRDAAALERLAFALYRAGRHAEAAETCRAWADIRPDHGLPHHLLGNALLALDDLAGAITANRHAVACEPARPEFHFNLGLVLERSGDDTAALAEYARANELRPDYVAGLCREAALLERRRDLDGASARYRAATAAGPGLPVTWLGLGRVLRAQDAGSPGARTALRQAARLATSSAEASRHLIDIAVLQTDAGDLDDARAALLKAIELATGDADRRAAEQALAGLPGASTR